METARVVEVLHDLGQNSRPRWLLGSGFIQRAGVVLTAAHNIGGSEEFSTASGHTYVRMIDGREFEVSTVLAMNTVLDIAVLGVEGIVGYSPAPFGRLDRVHVGVLDQVTAVGFPNYKRRDDRPPSNRPPAQPFGSVPTAEELSGGVFVLKVTSGLPEHTSDGGDSPWAGLSGAVVLCAESLLGIVIEHHPAEGLGALHFVPFAGLFDLPFGDQVKMTAALGMGALEDLTVLGAPPAPEVDGLSPEDQAMTELLKDLEQVRLLEAKGLMAPSVAQQVQYTAFMRAKGWD